MKKLAFNKWTLLLLLVNMVFQVQLNAANEQPAIGKKEFVKTIKKDFPISTTGEVAIHNKYGEVNIKTWNKAQVGIEVTITVDARNESDAESVFERISIDFSNGGSYVKAETNIESASKGWSWWGGSDKSDYKIDYEVFMPATAGLEVHNKYGNTFIEELDSEVRLEIKYGNFRLDAARQLEVYLGYGNGTVIKAGDTRAEVGYGKIRIKEVKDLDIESKYSKIYIDSGNDVNAESKYDTYSMGTIGDFNNDGKYDNIEIGYAENVNVDTRYSSLVMEKVGSHAFFEMEYGSARIDQLQQGFSDVKINGRYTDFKIYVAAGAHYQVDVETNHAGIYYPDALKVSYEMNKGSSNALQGYMGSKSDGGKIKARLSYGGIKIK